MESVNRWISEPLLSPPPPKPHPKCWYLRKSHVYAHVQWSSLAWLFGKWKRSPEKHISSPWFYVIFLLKSGLLCSKHRPTNIGCFLLFKRRTVIRPRSGQCWGGGVSVLFITSQRADFQKCVFGCTLCKESSKNRLDKFHMYSFSVNFT